MITIRPAHERGTADHGWLKTHHTFSFARYVDRNHMGFRSLRVMNEDFIAPGMGFGMHPHDNMEILTYVISGVLRHEDSMGNGELVRAGEFQRMSAGTGVRHSEFNASASEELHLYQIWLLPKELEIEPSYEQRLVSEEEMRGRLCLIASPDREAGSMSINQDSRIYISKLQTGNSLSVSIEPTRHLWVQVLQGQLSLGSLEIKTGDGAAISEEAELSIRAKESSTLLVFDLA